MAEAARLRHPRYPLGLLLIVLAGLCLSTGGLLLRHVETADVWEVSFYRSVGLGGTNLLYVLLVYRGRIVAPFHAIGWPGVTFAFLLALGALSYLFAISLTTVANVMFILSVAPLATAALAWLVLKERVEAVTWLAMVIAVVGIGIMASQGLVGGHLPGNLVALLAVATFAGMLTTLRAARSFDLVPASCLGGFLAALLCLPLANSLLLSAHDLTLALILGFGQAGLGFLLITIGTRFVPAAEVSLLALTEVILAPIWVWLFVNEVPDPLILVGGALVLAAVIGQGLYRLRQERQALARGQR